ncbi:MAG: hypothetical protein K2X11_21630 [Acetobacteraceae bacterium]|nr:hypothetical protein [Acetobacteraceae bacterium]
MRQTLPLLALFLGLGGPGIAQAQSSSERSFCNGEIGVSASARGRSDAQGNYVEYYAFVSRSSAEAMPRSFTIGFVPPAGVQARPPSRIELGPHGRQPVILGTERRPGGSITPGIPRGEIVNHVQVTCG